MQKKKCRKQGDTLKIEIRGGVINNTKQWKIPAIASLSSDR